jgi:hypothetical protein
MAILDLSALPDTQYSGDPSFQQLVKLAVVFEYACGNWAVKANALFQATQSYDREKLALILHSVPHLGNGNTYRTLKELLSIGYSIWLTGSKIYAVFASYLPVFIAGFDALLS